MIIFNKTRFLNLTKSVNFKVASTEIYPRKPTHWSMLTLGQSTVCYWYWVGSFGGKNGLGVKLTTDIRLVLYLKMYDCIYLLP